jgi:hypothetical protein
MGKPVVDIKAFTKLVIATAHGAHSTRYPETPSLEALQAMGGNGWVRSGLRPAAALSENDLAILAVLKGIVDDFSASQYEAKLTSKGDRHLILKIIDTRNAGPHSDSGRMNALSIKHNLFIEGKYLYVAGPKDKKATAAHPKFDLVTPETAEKEFQRLITHLAEEMGCAASSYAVRGVWTAAINGVAPAPKG